MAGCGHTAEEHQEEIRALLRKHQPDLAAWLEGDQAARIALAVLPSEPLFPARPRLVTDPSLATKGIAVVLDDDWDESREQSWMNEVRTARYRETGF